MILEHRTYDDGSASACFPSFQLPEKDLGWLVGILKSLSLVSTKHPAHPIDAQMSRQPRAHMVAIRLRRGPSVNW